MNILAFDTCFSACSVAVARSVPGGAHDICAHFETMATGHAERLLPMLRETLSMAGLDIHDINRLAVTAGPGTFTGMRTGVAAARALALATGAAVVTTTSLAVMAQTARNHAGDLIAHEQILVAVDARRGQVYAQLFGHGGLDPKCEPMLLNYSDAVQMGAPGPMTIVGTGAELVAGQARGSGRTLNTALLDLAVHAADLAAIAAELAALPTPVKPLYLRAPDAKPQTADLIQRAQARASK